MAESSYVFDATADNFRTLVLANSDKGPVVVNFWPPRAGPCLMLMPRLLKLAEEFRGRFLLVRLDTDELGRLARDQGVTSIPTTKVFRHGAVVDTLHGAESEASLRVFLRRHLGGPTDELRTAALRAFESGDAERAASLAAQAALAEPDDPRIPLDVAKLLVLQGRYAQAEALLAALPVGLREQEPVRNLLTHASLLNAARTAPVPETLERAIIARPDDLEARYRLGAARLMHNDYEGALAQLLEIARRDPLFRGGAGRNGLLALFGLLGEQDARTQRYRAELLNIAS
ncbi:MAG: tetratricopeptide repeat protein [Betaproteobacteria bacterium]|nr:tetratricopeptide repeat protein [Betaproteobacteria bacterium]